MPKLSAAGGGAQCWTRSGWESRAGCHHLAALGDITLTRYTAPRYDLPRVDSESRQPLGGAFLRRRGSSPPRRLARRRPDRSEKTRHGGLRCSSHGSGLTARQPARGTERPSFRVPQHSDQRPMESRLSLDPVRSGRCRHSRLSLRSADEHRTPTA